MAYQTLSTDPKNLNDIYRYLRSLTLVESKLLTLSALHVLFCISKYHID